MKEIMLWKILQSGSNLDVEPVPNVNETETENQLEEAITRCPALLMEDLKLIGRQTAAAGGYLDLLGVDGEGQLVVFELKRGVLTRDAVAQLIDYASYLAEMEADELAEHIASRSGNNGIEKIDDFLLWYQEQYGKSFPDFQRPRMVLVGLGADDRTKRMISFLSESDLDISLTTFHGFRDGDALLLARQVEVESRPTAHTALTKKTNLEKLKHKISRLRIDHYYYRIASFFRDRFPAAYEWPNPGGYSYSLPELTEVGNQSNRVYVSLYIHDSHPGRVQIYLYGRAVEAAAESFEVFRTEIGNRIHMRNDGNCEIWVHSQDDWNGLKSRFEQLCPAIVAGWKKKREQHSMNEFQAAESADGDEADETKMD